MTYRFFRNPGDGSKFSLVGDERPGTLIFAEGRAEACFMEAWLQSRNSDPGEVAVFCVKGDAKKLKTQLKNLSTEENFGAIRHFGFFVDAEQKLAASTISGIKDALAGADVVPANIKLVGGVQTVADKKIGIFVSPNNASSGCIEDLVLVEVMATQVAGCIAGFQRCVEEAIGQAVPKKSLVNMFLGIQQQGLAGAHLGFDKGFLDIHHEAYQPVRTVMSELI